ncbi:MAG: DUF488 domain-containing protein [Nitrosopumilus sp.]
MIKTKSIYKSKEREDGKRILISRLHPRGVKKSQYDEWLKELSPSIELVHEYKNDKISWKKFLSLYKFEISKNLQSLELIKQLRKQSKIYDVTLLCFEAEGDPCHRHLLREIINKPSFLNKSFIPKFIDT